MKLRAEFQNGMCKLFLTPEDEWEQTLIGAIAKDSYKLDGIVTYKPEGHFSYGKCKAVEIVLAQAAEQKE